MQPGPHTLPELGKVKGMECSSGVVCKPPGVRPPLCYMVFSFLDEGWCGRFSFSLLFTHAVRWSLFFCHGANGTDRMGFLGFRIGKWDWNLEAAENGAKKEKRKERDGKKKKGDEYYAGRQRGHFRIGIGIAAGVTSGIRR